MNPVNKLALFALGSLTLTLSPTLAAPRNGTSPTEKVVVVAELFTSEGCSSCPPADAVLADLEKQPVPGVEIIALGEHVDYWNNAHWADRFSSHALTQRQNDYATAFHNDQVYTPQLVVDGKTEFVGSDRDAALSAIARAARLQKAQVGITKTGASSVSVSVSHLPAGARGAQVWLAVTQDGLQSQVRGGENAGRHLTHAAVVRVLRPLGAAHEGAQWTVPAPAGDGSRVVAFVQENGNGRVLGAALLRL